MNDNAKNEKLVQFKPNEIVHFKTIIISIK